MLTQLIANAMEAMPANESDGEIRIGSQRRPDGIICAEIANNGPCIAPRGIARIFKPFFTSKTKGLGLGLPLVRRVVERLGGSLEMDSTPGAGTVVRLLLPPGNREHGLWRPDHRRRNGSRQEYPPVPGTLGL